MYNPNYVEFGPVGWTCPKCGRVYSPFQNFCLYCNDKRVYYATQTTAKPEWIYKEDTFTCPPNNISWEDELRRHIRKDD